MPMQQHKVCIVRVQSTSIVEKLDYTILFEGVE